MWKAIGFIEVSRNDVWLYISFAEDHNSKSMFYLILKTKGLNNFETVEVEFGEIP